LISKRIKTYIQLYWDNWAQDKLQVKYKIYCTFSTNILHCLKRILFMNNLVEVYKIQLLKLKSIYNTPKQTFTKKLINVILTDQEIRINKHR